MATTMKLDPETVAFLTVNDFELAPVLLWDVQVTSEYVRRDDPLGDEDAFGRKIRWVTVERGLTDKAHAERVATHYVRHNEYQAARLVSVAVRVVREAEPVLARLS